LFDLININNYVLSLTKGPQPRPKQVFHTVRSSASSFNLDRLLVFIRSSGGCVDLFPRLSVPSGFLQ